MLIGLGSSGIAVVRQAGTEPNGEWDAFAVWNLQARFLYRGSAGAWTNIFDPAVTNGGYPLLLPGLVNGAWTVVGDERPIVPALLAIGFGLCPSALSGAAFPRWQEITRMPFGTALTGHTGFSVFVSGSNSRHPYRSIYSDNCGASAVCRSMAGGQAADAGAGGSVRGLCSLDEKRRASVCGCRAGEPSGDVGATASLARPSTNLTMIGRALRWFWRC